MGEGSEKGPGHPKRSASPRTIDIKSVDPVTSRMIDALVSYGRFGETRPAVALFIIRTWLFENEDRLKGAIAAREAPLGHVYPEPE
jgi:hypothetical protein